MDYDYENEFLGKMKLIGDGESNGRKYSMYSPIDDYSLSVKKDKVKELIDQSKILKFEYVKSGIRLLEDQFKFVDTNYLTEYENNGELVHFECEIPILWIEHTKDKKPYQVVLQPTVWYVFEYIYDEGEKA